MLSNNLMSQSAIELFEDKLVRLVKERTSIIWIKTYDKESVYDLFEKLCSENGYNTSSLSYKMNCNRILTWNIAYGKKMFKKSNSDTTVDEKLHITISDFAQEEDYDILILDDISHLLSPNHEDALTIISKLQEFSYNNTKWRQADKKKNKRPKNQKSIIIISPILDIIDNLNHMVEVLEDPIPDETDIRRELGFDILETDSNLLATTVKKKKGYEFGRYKYSHSFIKDQSNRKKLVSSLLGMHMYDIRKLLYSLLSHSAMGMGLNVYDDVSGKYLSECVSDEKKRIVQNSGLLQVINIDFNEQKNRVGNIDNLKSHLIKQKEIIDHIEEYNPKMPKPKGILLVGAPGCGKSEAAKSVAAILEKPLLRLDIGALMGQYVGVSEHNLIEAIKIAEAAQPCVLWIDEIEKAFAGFSNSDSGNDITVMRMVGYFLTWMQERKSLVYLVATANSLDNLRPELLRKGRWDKIMYLSYPDKDGIKDIFIKCLQKYELKLDVDCDFSYIDFRKLVDTIYDQEMSGADIDTLIVEAYNRLFVQSPYDNHNKISVSECIRIAKETNVLESRKESDKELVEENMLNYKINNGHFDWDETRGTLLQRSMDEYHLSSGNFDYNTNVEELVEEAIKEIKISRGETYLAKEHELKELIRDNITKKRNREKKAKELLEQKLLIAEKEKQTIKETFEKRLCHKGREEQIKYYKTKGYESASGK